MMRVAYLVTQYPKISHAFIRREIAELVAQGVEVERYSVRPPPEDLVDPADAAEQDRTRVLLNVGLHGLCWAGLLTLLSRPIRFLRGFSLAVRLGIGSDRGLLRNLAYLAEACLLRGWLARAGCQHVHAHFGTNSTMVAMLCRIIGGPPYSFTVHGPEEFDKVRPIALAEKIRESAFVVGISSYGRSQLFRWCSVDDWRKVHVVRCGIDERYIDAQITPVPDVPRLVCVGRLCEQKGQQLLVEAVARLVEDGVAVELVLAGDGEMRPDVERAIAKWKLGDHVRITGWVSNAEINEELRAARALVLPSFAEGLPVVIMEALALGRPVVTTYVAGIPELVKPGQNGWLVPAGSVDALAAALRELLSANSEELTRMGGRGRQAVLEAHDIRKSAAQLKEHFRESENRTELPGLPV